MNDIKIIEFKAKCEDHTRLQKILAQKNARYAGEDRQIDTYFRIREGRLKLREGAIERTLIFYRRPDQAGPKRSDVMLYPIETNASGALRALLSEAIGVKVIVDKRRHIYYLDNVKIHLDRVVGLGSFVEVEAIDDDGSKQVDALRRQCQELLDDFSIFETDLISHSYSDLLLKKNAS